MTALDSSPAPPRSVAAACLAALALTAAVFVAKYGADVPGVSQGGAVALGAVVALGYAFAVGGLLWKPQARSGLADGLVVLALVVAVGLAWVAPEANAVARSPAIGEWLGALSDGAFPYCTPQRPSGMPGLFLLLSPFWAAGALWLIAPAGIGLTWLAVRRHVGDSQLAVAVAFLSLPAVWYEVIVRSELVVNGALAVIAAFVGARATRSTAGSVAAAVLGGVVLSTRLTAGVALVAAGGVWLRRSPRLAIAYGLIASAMFAATLLPFAVWDGARFAACGPFSIQGLYLPAAVKLGLVGATVAVGFLSRSTRGALVGAGLVIWTGAALSLGVRVSEAGWTGALWGDGFDVGYLVLGVPMLLLGLADTRRHAPERVKP